MKKNETEKTKKFRFGTVPPRVFWLVLAAMCVSLLGLVVLLSLSPSSPPLRSSFPKSYPPCPPPRPDDSDPKRHERLVLGKTVEEAEKIFPFNVFVDKESKKITRVSSLG